MRIWNITLIASFVTVMALSTAGADEVNNRPLPPEIASQLTDDQRTQLQNASSMQERISLLKSWGVAPPAGSRYGFHPGANGDIPPFLKEKLTTDQQTQLKAAQTMEEKKALLDSWGIKMPAPPRRPKLDSDNQAKLDSLKTKLDSAQTDEERESIREQIHELFRSSMNEEDKTRIRQFFKDNGSKFPSQTVDTQTTSAASVE